MSITTAPIEPLSLRELVAEAIECYGSKLRGVRKYIVMNSDREYAPDAVKKAFDAHNWQALRHQARDMSPAELVKAVTGQQRTLARNIGKPREGYHRIRLQIFDEARQRRGIQLPEPKTKAVRVKRASGTKAPAQPQAEQPALFDATSLIGRLRQRVA